MEVSKVTEADGQACARLLQVLSVANRLFDAMKIAGLPVSGPGMDHREEIGRWLGSIAKSMGEQLKASRSAPTGMKVRSMGKLPDRKKARGSR